METIAYSGLAYSTRTTSERGSSSLERGRSGCKVALFYRPVWRRAHVRYVAIQLTSGVDETGKMGVFLIAYELSLGAHPF